MTKMKLAFMITMNVPEGAKPESYKDDLQVTLDHRRIPMATDVQVKLQYMIPGPLESRDNG